jgi:hypothetical protein
MIHGFTVGLLVPGRPLHTKRHVYFGPQATPRLEDQVVCALVEPNRDLDPAYRRLPVEFTVIENERGDHVWTNATRLRFPHSLAEKPYEIAALGLWRGEQLVAVGSLRRRTEITREREIEVEVHDVEWATVELEKEGGQHAIA